MGSVSGHRTVSCGYEVNIYAFYFFFQLNRINSFKKEKQSCVWRYMPVIPALGSQKQGVEVSSEASLVYVVSARPVRTVHQGSVSK